MTERPILFQAAMVRAILEGRKTQTRRAFRDQPPPGVRVGFVPGHSTTPYGVPGDRLYCRETWAAPHAFDHLPPRLIPAGTRIHYAASEDRGGLLWRPSIHMPRWASRITLEITEVRVERLQSISEADALAEGVATVDDGFGLADGSHFHAADPRQSYFSLWAAINGADSVAANPWCWAVSFRPLAPTT